MPRPEPTQRQPRRPFFRQSMTLAPAWDPDAAITIEVIVLAPEEGVSDPEQESTALREDMPELGHAGWEWQSSIKGLEVFTRVVG